MNSLNNLEVMLTERMKDYEREMEQMRQFEMARQAQPRLRTVWQSALHGAGALMVVAGERLQRSVAARPALAGVGIEPELCECE